MTSSITDQNQTELLIFTDLDGTLLDSSYSFDKSLPALEIIKEKQVPLVICSSKTRAEIEVIRKGLGNDYPFVSENGGGIFIPKGSGPADRAGRITVLDKLDIQEDDNYQIIKLGADYTDLRAALAEIRDEGFDVMGFGDMSPADVADLTGLTESAAELAKRRQFDETFIVNGDEASVRKLKERINFKGFNYTQGEYFHIMGNSDKGRAVGIMKRLYETEGVKVMTAALGDSPNDIEMLNNVDRPFVVQKEDGTYDPQIVSKVKGCVKVAGIGPEGWNKAVLELIKEFQ